MSEPVAWIALSAAIGHIIKTTHSALAGAQKGNVIMSVAQDVEFAAQAFAGIETYLSGGVATTEVSAGGKEYAASVRHLANGPVAPFTPFSGSIYSILLLLFSDAASLASGDGFSLAIKFGESWVGFTLAEKK